MKITEIRVTPINIPLTLGYVRSVGINYGFAKTIVEVFTDEESSASARRRPTCMHASSTRSSRPAWYRLVGTDPFNLATYERRCLPEWQSARDLSDVQPGARLRRCRDRLSSA